MEYSQTSPSLICLANNLSTMRFSAVALALALLVTMPTAIVVVEGFMASTRDVPAAGSSALVRASSSTSSSSSCDTLPATITASRTAPFRAEKIVNGVIFSGDPPETAYEMNHYEILQQHSIRAPGTGDAVPFSDLLRDAAAADGNTSHIVVFLRSLG
jgi:hypothetical protein